MREHSRLIQKEIRTVSCSDREFEKTPGGIPIVLVPKSPFIFQVGVEIPSGCFVLWQQWLRDMGQIDPGIVWFWPSWNRISHIVTRAAITYNAPVLNCPTADNGKIQKTNTLHCQHLSIMALLRDVSFEYI